MPAVKNNVHGGPPKFGKLGQIETPKAAPVKKAKKA
jgi:hypothetical protein